MDTLHTVLRSMNGGTKGRRGHLDIFREFIGHLDRSTPRKLPTCPTKNAKEKPSASESK